MRESFDAPESTLPLVSVILPTYNRAQFLPEAIQSICQQHWANWELIIVDDGSTDETAELLPKLTGDIGQPVRAIRQENQGAYAARNTGLDHARGKFIAFFDSDDLWLPHHLLACVEALEANGDVDWAYGASRLIDADTQDVISENCFYDGDKPRPFLALTVECRGNWRVLCHSNLLEQVLGGVGLYAGLQNSVIRRSVFNGRRFVVAFYNEAEDQVAVVRAIAAGKQLAYINRVHVIYRVHEGNSSGAAKSIKVERQTRLMEGLVHGYEVLLTELPLSPAERRALRRRVARQMFWNLGYATLWRGGYPQEALAVYRRALRLWPWDWRYWKTLVACRLKLLLR